MTDATGDQVLGHATIAGVETHWGEHSLRLEPSLRWRVVQATLDFFTVLFASSSTYAIYLLLGVGQQHYEPMLYAKLCIILAALTVFVLYSLRTYHDQMGLLRIEDVRRIICATGSGLLLLLCISFLWKLPDFSRLTGLMLYPVIVCVLVLQRGGVDAARKRFRFLHRTSRPVLIYGAGKTGRLLAQCMSEEHHVGLKPIGFLDDDSDLRYQMVKVGRGVHGGSLRVFGTEEDLDKVLEKTDAVAVFLAMPSATSDRIADLVATLENRRVPSLFLPSAGDLQFMGLQFGQVAGMPVLTRRRPVRNRPYFLVRRAMDIIGASAVLLLVSPLLAVSALAIKLISPGPILFKQTRIGWAGREFEIYKLRTMHQDSPKYARHPEQADDARVFGLGRWLRRFSIDEFPQLWNVLKGDMSLVGPRPEMPFIVAGYDETQRQRLLVPPGLTGLWQISEDRAYSIHDNIHYDLYYVENRSVSLDLAIMMMTPFVLLARNRAK